MAKRVNNIDFDMSPGLGNKSSASPTLSLNKSPMVSATVSPNLSPSRVQENPDFDEKGNKINKTLLAM